MWCKDQRKQTEKLFTEIKRYPDDSMANPNSDESPRRPRSYPLLDTDQTSNQAYGHPRMDDGRYRYMEYHQQGKSEMPYMELEMWQVPVLLREGASNVPPAQTVLCEGIIKGIQKLAANRPTTPSVFSDIDRSMGEVDDPYDGAQIRRQPQYPPVCKAECPPTFIDDSPFRTTRGTGPDFYSATPTHLYGESSGSFAQMNMPVQNEEWIKDELLQHVNNPGFPGVMVVPMQTYYRMPVGRSTQPMSSMQPNMTAQENFPKYTRWEQNATSRPVVGTVKKTPMRPPSAHKLCRYGDKCFARNCQFGHPTKKPLFIPKYPKDKKENQPPHRCN